jgi:hypothetical protein
MAVLGHAFVLKHAVALHLILYTALRMASLETRIGYFKSVFNIFSLSLRNEFESHRKSTVL